MGDSLRFPPATVLRPPLRGLSPQRVGARAKSDPIALALVACGAKRVDSGHFRLPDGIGELVVSSAALPFEVWQIPERQDLRGHRDWRLGVRSGRHARGTPTYKIQIAPSGMRRVGARGILDVLTCPDQAGDPASMNTDAGLAYAVMRYLSAELAFEGCRARRSLLVRLEGQTTRGHTGSKTELSKRVEMGFFP